MYYIIVPHRESTRYEFPDYFAYNAARKPNATRTAAERADTVIEEAPLPCTSPPL